MLIRSGSPDKYRRSVGNQQELAFAFARAVFRQLAGGDVQTHAAPPYRLSLRVKLYAAPRCDPSYLAVRQDSAVHVFIITPAIHRLCHGLGHGIAILRMDRSQKAAVIRMSPAGDANPFVAP